MNSRLEILKERVPHGDAMFPLMVHEIETDMQLRERVGCHWHEEIELLAATKGRAQIRLDDRSYEVQAGQLVFIPSDRLHAITGYEGEPFCFFAVVFHQALLNSYLNDSIQQKYIDAVRDGRLQFPEWIVPDEPWEKEVLALLTAIRTAFERRELAFELLIKAKLFEIWFLLCAHAVQTAGQTKGGENSRIALVKEMIQYLKENYERKISLHELSVRFAMSEGQVCRFFKTMTQMSVMEYLNYYRISRSIRLLTETDRDVSGIAGQTGFNTISYYNRVFQRYMHMTPTQFRRKMQEGEN